MSSKKPFDFNLFSGIYLLVDFGARVEEGRFDLGICNGKLFGHLPLDRGRGHGARRVR